jgi:hypothetical protein
VKKDVKGIIKQTLGLIQLDSESARDMIYTTGMAETGYRCLKQKGGGPAVGFFQCEPATARDIWENYALYRPQYRDALYRLGFDESNMNYCILSNIGLQVAFCRLHYRRVPKKLPRAGDLAGQARYWKAFYNTVKGKGTEKHFIDTNGGIA